MRVLLSLLAVAALAFVVYELRAPASAPATHPVAGEEVASAPLGTTSAPPAHKKAGSPKIASNLPAAAPGQYVPRGFPPNFRAMIVHDFGGVIDARLGKDWSPEKRAAIAKIQNELWDEHGPNVDAFADHKISQPEFAERTHNAFAHASDRYAQVLSDSEYEKLFDVPRGSDQFYLLFHSAKEQPGMPIDPYDDARPMAANLPPPAEPEPSGPKNTSVSKGDRLADPPPSAVSSPPPPPPPPSSSTKG